MPLCWVTDQQSFYSLLLFFRFASYSRLGTGKGPRVTPAYNPTHTHTLVKGVFPKSILLYIIYILHCLSGCRWSGRQIMYRLASCSLAQSGVYSISLISNSKVGAGLFGSKIEKSHARRLLENVYLPHSVDSRLKCFN